jgi:16S rRNA (adenine1518-N6/adenine1519-N6)-dimethyltransferase
MIQKEAAQRICAAPGTRDAGAISFAVRYFSEPKILFKVSKGSFFPAPKVGSAVINIKVKKELALTGKNEELFFYVVKSIFAQRRKTLVNSLAKAFDMPKNKVLQLFYESQININSRGEEFTFNELIKIMKLFPI